MKLIRKLKDTLISNSHLIVLGVVLGACQKNCSHDEGYEVAGMAMEIDKYTLKGSDTTIHISIKNNGENVASLDNFCLRASITERVTGSMLAYPDANNNPKSKAKIDELLTHFTTKELLDPEESVTIELQVQPRTGASRAIIALKLYDTSKKKTVAAKTVTWSATSYKLSFINIPAKLKDEEEIRFQISNEGETDVNTAGITVCLNSTEGVEFELDGQKGANIEASLASILHGTKKKLAKNNPTKVITLKLSDARGKNSSTITLALKQGGTSLAQKTVAWSATSYKLSFINIPAKLKDEEIRFQISNEGETDVNTAGITVCLNSTEGVEFELDGQKGANIEISLTNIIRGTKKKLAKGNLTRIITLRLADARGKSFSTITLALKQGGTSLAQKTVTWLASSYQLSFINIPAKLKDDKEIQFQISNEGETDVNTAGITVCLNSTEGVEFELDGQKGANIEISLTNIIRGTKKKLAKGNLTRIITLRLSDAHGKNSSTITLALKQGSIILAQKTVKWGESEQGLRLRLDKTELYGEDIVHGTLIAIEKYSLGKVSLECKIVKGNKSKNKKNNAVVHAKIDKEGYVTIRVYPMKKPTVIFNVQLKYAGKNIGEPQEVTWQKKT